MRSVALRFVAGVLLCCAPAVAQYHGERYLRPRPRIFANDYLMLPNFPGTRVGLPFAPAGANALTAMPFHLDRYFRVRRVSIIIIEPQAGSHVYAGLYDCSGNLLVQAKFPTDAIGNLTVEVPAVLLKPGMYYFAIGAEDTNSKGMGYLFDIGAEVNSGTAGAQISDAGMPDKLNTVTPPQPGSVPTVVFRP